MEDKLLKDLFLGFIKAHILHHANKERIYGQEFSEELKRHGYHISYGTLYPIFHKLEEQGYLISETENVNGKIRRYYSITKNGKKILEKAKQQAKELVDELYEI
ncbi:putative transcriptional regulator, PadR family protein [Melioribacter roseus P3M-2]|uniref:Putative transcriptional regulator, PadR family protein n=1 Tax=Melioribacter roseus (strain DSM 23840 / JCM 17771 / VKM B-2668 / P3M-2) TaxID=1191523 RepID=I6YU18_MELRP|nr:PadR family transcriptional regulator [Melioribacter roseus]AFN74027.1 putative transcriptional regulator, PadR family protein [Melioribacter roseus P3M-2]